MRPYTFIFKENTKPLMIFEKTCLYYVSNYENLKQKDIKEEFNLQT
jgi:hypothetical protein